MVSWVAVATLWPVLLTPAKGNICGRKLALCQIDSKLNASPLRASLLVQLLCSLISGSLVNTHFCQRFLSGMYFSIFIGWCGRLNVGDEVGQGGGELENIYRSVDLTLEQSK